MDAHSGGENSPAFHSWSYLDEKPDATGQQQDAHARGKQARRQRDGQSAQKAPRYCTGQQSQGFHGRHQPEQEQIGAAGKSIGTIEDQ